MFIPKYSLDTSGMIIRHVQNISQLAAFIAILYNRFLGDDVKLYPLQFTNYKYPKNYKALLRNKGLSEIVLFKNSNNLIPPMHKRNSRTMEESERRNKRKRTDCGIATDKLKKVKKIENNNTQTHLVENKQTNRSGKPTIQIAIKHFRDIISTSCEYVCVICNQLWFKTSMKSASTLLKLKSKKVEESMTNMISIDGKKYVCFTCYRSLSLDKYPTCSVKNGMSFSAIPDELKGL